MSRTRALIRPAAIVSVFSLVVYGQVLLATSAQAQPFSGGLSPTVFGAAADLNGDGVVSGRDDSNAFYGDTSIIDGKLDCDTWGVTANAGTAGSGTITAADTCTLVGYDGSADGVTITVATGSFVLADLVPIPDGTALPTVFNAADPDNASVAASDFAWSTIGGRVDANGDEAIDADDCSLGLIGVTVDAGLGGAHDGADVVSSDASGVDPCAGLIGPAAADDGLVDLNSDGNITFAGDSCADGCFLGHDVLEGVVQEAPAISIDDVTISEAAGTADFTVSLSQTSQSVVTVDFITVAGTATAGSDYTTASGTVTFVAGDLSEPVSITVLNDSTDESDETFFVNLFSPSNGVIADPQGLGTIQDNDIPQTFNDVPPGHFAFEAVDALVRAGITAGCSTSPPLYCPNADVTRGQMAVFLLRAMGHGAPSHLPAYRGIFTDVPASNPFARFIEHLYDHGVTSGCSTSPRMYCPNDSVTRGQMAVFLLRAIGHGASSHLGSYQGTFADVPSSNPFARYIEHLYSPHSVTAGCATNPLRYCPSADVTRAQMAIFLVRTFGL